MDVHRVECWVLWFQVVLRVTHHQAYAHRLPALRCTRRLMLSRSTAPPMLTVLQVAGIWCTCSISTSKQEVVLA